MSTCKKSEFEGRKFHGNEFSGKTVLQKWFFQKKLTCICRGKNFLNKIKPLLKDKYPSKVTYTCHHVLTPSKKNKIQKFGLFMYIVQ